MQQRLCSEPPNLVVGDEILMIDAFLPLYHVTNQGQWVYVEVPLRSFVSFSSEAMIRSEILFHFTKSCTISVKGVVLIRHRRAYTVLILNI
jgi:hypothetical protein